MALALKFLGWDRPFLHSVASFLLSKCGEKPAFDLRHLTVVLPGARAGRRLLDILVEEAGKSGSVLLPPRVITAGVLPELLYSPALTPASDLERVLLRAELLCRESLQSLKVLVPFPPEKDQLTSWLMLARAIEALQSELSGGCLVFPDVARLLAEKTDLPDDPRWELLEEHQQKFIKELKSLNLCDLQSERLQALSRSSFSYPGEIVLAGMSDLNEMTRRFIKATASPVTSLVFAPEKSAAFFDDLGCIVVKKWLEAEIPVQDSHIAIAGSPSEQSVKIASFLSSLEGKYDSSQVTVGTGDETLEPWIKQTLEERELKTRHSSGRAISKTSPYLFLKALSDYLTSYSFTDFATLVRHPEVLEFVRAPLAAEEQCILTALDEWQSSHLQDRIFKGSFFGNETVKKTYEALETLLQGLLSEKAPLSAWASPLAAALSRLFSGKTLVRSAEKDRNSVEALELVASILGEISSLPERLSVEVSAAQAIKVALSLLSGSAIPYQPEKDVIRISGWLELQMDDAPCLAVAGFNDGLIPQSVTSDMFLPNQIKSLLGLLDNDRRYARDAFALSSIIQSRERFLAVTGKFDKDGAPLKHSRLLFAVPPGRLAGRVSLLYSDLEEKKGRSLPTGKENAFKIPVEPPALNEPLNKISVSAFQSYINCPYRYYLSYVLKLGELDDLSVELDAPSFGNVAHEVLLEFGKNKEVNSLTDSVKIEEFLNQALDRVFSKTFGSQALSTVMIQKEQLKGRLSAFAKWQAGWAKKGWRIIMAEKPFDKTTSPLTLKLENGKEVLVTGRVDRVDFNAKTSEWIVLDYKTGDFIDKAKTSHITKSGEWKNLQLPLYVLWFLQQEPGATVRSGYMKLTSSEGDIKEDLAEFSDEELKSARKKATEIAEKISEGIFWPPSEDIAEAQDSFAYICGTGQLKDDESDKEGALE